MHINDLITISNGVEARRSLGGELVPEDLLSSHDAELVCINGYPILYWKPANYQVIHIRQRQFTSCCVVSTT